MLESLRKLFALLDKREKRNFFVVLFLMVMLVFLEMARVGSVLPFIGAIANPDIIQNNDIFRAVYELAGEPSYQTFFVMMGFVLIGITLFRNGWHALTDYGIIRYSSMRSHTFSTRLLERYLSQPYSYFLRHNTTTLRRNVLGEVGTATSFLKNTLNFLAQLLKAVGLLILIIVADPLLAVISAGVLAALYGSTYFLIRGRLSKFGKRRLRTNRERFKAASESLEGIKTVRAHDRENEFLEKFGDSARRFAKLKALIDILSTVPKYVLDSVVYGGIIGVVLFYVTFVGSIGAELATLGLFVVAASRLMPALKQTLNNYSKMRGEFPAVDVIYRDMHRDAAVDLRQKILATAPSGARRITVEDAIKAENLVFKYQGADTALFNNLSITVEANTTVGVVGTTGCGKTTFMDILLGLLSPQSGHIRVDDTVITEQNVAAWRRNIGYVPQDIFLTDDSVTRNIAFGVPDEEVDHDAVQRAAGVAHIARFVEEELPDGYDTHVGERGVRLSGGQRQRLGIARALYHNPGVLVFDEATSALDSRTEKDVMRFIDDLAHEKTIVMIAHRLSTVERCDKIYVMEKGRVIDEGDYATLLARNEQFRALAQVSP